MVDLVAESPCQESFRFDGKRFSIGVLGFHANLLRPVNLLEYPGKAQAPFIPQLVSLGLNDAGVNEDQAVLLPGDHGHSKVHCHLGRCQADTVKGKGVDFMERNIAWHAGSLGKEDLEKALNALASTRKVVSA